MLHLFLGVLGLDLSDRTSLLGDSIRSSSSGGLVLRSSSLHLVGEDLGSGLLSLGLVDEFHENSLVLEDVSLSFHVELVVQVFGDFTVLSVLSEHASQDTLSSHPEGLRRHSSLGRSLSLSRSGVTSLGLGLLVGDDSRSRVDDIGLDDDVSISLESSDVLSGVGVGDFGEVGRVEVDLSLSDTEDLRNDASVSLFRWLSRCGVVGGRSGES